MKAIHYMEIVSNDADALCGLYERVHGLSFGPPDADLGQARVAIARDGTLVGIRKPLAAHEAPIIRTYVAVEDIRRFESEFLDYIQHNQATIFDTLATAKSFDAGDALEKLIGDFKKQFQPSAESK